MNSRLIKAPTIRDMQVIPVLGGDSMLLNLRGAHPPYFRRNIVLLTSSDGYVGVGEAPGGKRAQRALTSFIELVVGTQIARLQGTLERIRHECGICWGVIEHPAGASVVETRLSQSRKLYEYQPSFLAAIECALLDILGQYLGVPICELIAAGRQCDHIQVAAPLYFLGDHRQTNLPYSHSLGRSRWHAIRHKEALTASAIADLADAARECYGIRDFRLVCGVMRPESEIHALAEIRQRQPDSVLAVDPQGAWPLTFAIEALRPQRHNLAYVIDPCAAEQGYSDREILAEFRRATSILTASNLCAGNWRQMAQAHRLGSLDIPMLELHRWGMQAAVRAAHICHEWGLNWGLQETTHFDISLAMLVQTAAASPSATIALGTHWIHQEGIERLTHEPLQIEDGAIRVPEKGGLGVEPDMEQIRKAHDLHKRMGSKIAHQGGVMQFLVSGWSYDPKRPSLCI